MTRMETMEMFVGMVSNRGYYDVSVRNYNDGACIVDVTTNNMNDFEEVLKSQSTVLEACGEYIVGEYNADDDYGESDESESYSTYLNFNGEELTLIVSRYDYL